MQDVQRLNVRNISTIIDILDGKSERDYGLTHGVMAKYNSDTRQALQDQGMGPMPAGTELNPDDCEFCIEGLMVFLFEPESLTYIPFIEDDNWTYGYQTDDRSTTDSAISDPRRFYPQHLGFSQKLASLTPNGTSTSTWIPTQSTVHRALHATGPGSVTLCCPEDPHKPQI